MSAQSLGGWCCAAGGHRDLYATFGMAAPRWYLAPVSSTVADLTGRPPRGVREVLEAHRAELPVG